MDTSTNLLLPFIMPQQAQKSVTHNEAIEALDALVMLSIKSRALAAAPSTPADGDRYVVGAAATGAWAGRDGDVAAWQAGSWSFFTPREGWLAWCSAESGLLVFSGGAWSAAGTGGGTDSMLELGINATPDATNRLSVAAAATLLSHEGTDHRLMINKAATANTASLIFQDNFSGRAEIGLAGDDRLSLKVSADGASFSEALGVDSSTGKVSFPATNLLTDYAANLYQDSGRMSGNGVFTTAAGSYAFPAYFSLYNSSTQAALAKYIFDNTDYGGASGALDSNVKALVDKIRDPAFRRFGPEFWVATVTMGAGVSSAPQLAGGKTGYLSLYTAQRVTLPAMTFHIYLRALTKEVVLPPSPGQTYYKNGIAQSGNFLVAPADGWVSITVAQKVVPYTNSGYNPSIFYVYAQAPGDQYLLACPALMGGITGVDDNIGVIASTGSWPA